MAAILKMVNWLVVALLSAAAGLAKLLQAPQEVAFFATLGLSPTVLALFGAAQLAAAALVYFEVTRRAGAALAALLLAASAAMLWQTGQLSFALVSLLPVALAVLVVLTGGAVGEDTGEGRDGAE